MRNKLFAHKCTMYMYYSVYVLQELSYGRVHITSHTLTAFKIHPFFHTCIRPSLCSALFML